MKRFSLTAKAAALLLAVSIFLGITLLVPSCYLNLLSRDNVITEEQYDTLVDVLSANVDAGCDKRYANVTSYLTYWKFPAFDQNKIRYIENTYNNRLIDDLGYSDPEKLYTLAIAVANYYIDNILTKDGEIALTYEQIQDKNLQTDAIAVAYAKSVGDRYSRYYDAQTFAEFMGDLSGTFGGIGVYATLDRVENTITVTDTITGSAAETAGILPGDMIIKVDDTLLADSDVDTVMDLIRGEIGTSVTVTVLRGETELSFTMVRAVVDQPSVEYAVLEGDIIYMVITDFNDNTDDQFIAAIDEIEATYDVKGYIFDLRNNGGGYSQVAVNILSYFVPRGTHILSEVRRSGTTNFASNSDHLITVPMVVLCNGNTASAAELFTASIRDFRNDGLLEAKIVGKTTYGKGKMQNIYALSDGSAMVFTTGLFNPPCDVNFDGVGITPDVELELTTDGITDDQFYCALDELQKMIND